MLFFPFPRRAMSNIDEHELVRGRRWAVISISHNSDFAEIKRNGDCKGLLQLLFADIDAPMEGWELFTSSQAKEILTFTKEMQVDKVDVMIVHCHAGKSRSPAVCAALAEYCGQSSNLYFSKYIPNMHVYRTLMDLIQKETYHGSE